MADMDPAEFLTAQYDEAEADAHSFHEAFCQFVTDPSSGHCDCGYPARVLADIAAKRAIVEHARDMRAAYEEDTFDEARSSSDVTMDHVLKLLAAPYAEHPDYDPAWSVA